jgi:DNA-binding NarL/FixJ family response regulator
MPNLTENVKVHILSKLEEGWSIQRVAQYYNIAKSTVQGIKQTILWSSKISATFYVVKFTNLYKKYDRQISKRHLYMGKKL